MSKTNDEVTNPVERVVMCCITGDPYPEKEGNLTDVSQFEIGKYYWARYNCDFLIGEVSLRLVGDDGDYILYLHGDGWRHDLPMALKVFSGGVYGPLTPPYET